MHMYITNICLYCIDTDCVMYIHIYLSQSPSIYVETIYVNIKDIHVCLKRKEKYKSIQNFLINVLINLRIYYF